MSVESLAQAIRDIQDFPKPGIVFKDITPVLRDANLFEDAVNLMAQPWTNTKPDAVAAIDARGFILGGAVAYKLGVGFIPIRKEGKLPWDVDTVEYELEYGTDSVEMHSDAVASGQSILLVDDLLATGGTAKAAVELIEKSGGKVAGVQFLIELCFLKGRDGLEKYNVNSLIEEK